MIMQAKVKFFAQQLEKQTCSFAKQTIIKFVKNLQKFTTKIILALIKL